MALLQRYLILPCPVRLLHSLSCVFPKVWIQMGGLLTGKFIFCPQSWFLLISGASCMSNCASFITSNNGVEPCQALAPLSIGFAVFMVHLATIPVTGTGINRARSFGAAVIYGHKKSWDDHWIFWVGPLIGATVAAAFHKYVIRASLKWHSKEPNNV